MSDIELDQEKSIFALKEAAQGVFADMAFIDVEPAPQPIDETSGDFVRVAIDVLVPLSLRIELHVARTLMQKMSDTLYGDSGLLEDGSPSGRPDVSKDDSLLEIVNVLSGTFLSHYFGSGVAFKMELPFFIFGGTEISGPEMVRLSLDAEGEALVILLRSIRYRY